MDKLPTELKLLLLETAACTNIRSLLVLASLNRELRELYLSFSPPLLITFANRFIQDEQRIACRMLSELPTTSWVDAPSVWYSCDCRGECDKQFHSTYTRLCLAEVLTDRWCSWKWKGECERGVEVIIGKNMGWLKRMLRMHANVRFLAGRTWADITINKADGYAVTSIDLEKEAFETSYWKGRAFDIEDSDNSFDAYVLTLYAFFIRTNRIYNGANRYISIRRYKELEQHHEWMSIRTPRRSLDDYRSIIERFQKWFNRLLNVEYHRYLDPPSVIKTIRCFGPRTLGESFEIAVQGDLESIARLSFMEDLDERLKFARELIDTCLETRSRLKSGEEEKEALSRRKHMKLVWPDIPQDSDREGVDSQVGI